MVKSSQPRPSVRGGRKSPENRKSVLHAPTMVDLFLSGANVEGSGQKSAFHQDGKPQWVPDPEVCLNEQHEDAEGENQMTKDEWARLRQEAKRELSVQEYWKRHAGLPQNWPHLAETILNCTNFERGFRQHAFGFNKSGHARSLHFKMAFVVTSMHKVGIRDSPTTNPDLIREGQFLLPGHCIMVDVTLKHDDCTYIKLDSGGWVFDRLEGKQLIAHMNDAEVGLWWYKQMCSEYVETRKAPSFTDESRTGHLLCPQEVIVVCCRCVINGQQFLRLADGRGWVFVYRQSADGEEKDESKEQEEKKPLFTECLGELMSVLDEAEDGGLDGAAGKVIEKGLWKYQVLDESLLVIGASMSGAFLLPGDMILVDQRVPASGLKTKEVSAKKQAFSVVDRIWLRLEGGKGWIPKTNDKNFPFVRFLGMMEDSKRNRRFGVEPRDLVEEDDSVGVA